MFSCSVERAAPESALAWVDSQPHLTVSGGLRTAVVEAMAEKDPAAALDLMKSRGWLARHPKAILKVLQNWGGSDPAAALQGLRDLSAEMGLTSKLEAAKIDPSAYQETSPSASCSARCSPEPSSAIHRTPLRCWPS